jgi:acetate kinase
MDHTAVSRFLKEQVSLFNTFGESTIASLIQGAALVSYEPNELMIEFGEEVSFLGVLLEGSAEVAVVDDGGSRHVLKTLTPGEIFGEMEMMTGNRSVANVTAAEPCQVLQITGTLFASAIATNMQAVSCLSRIIVERLQNTPDAASFAAITNSAVRHSDDPYGFKLKTDKPMKLLVVNCGSSSLKYRLYDTWNASENARGVVERIGTDEAAHTFEARDTKTTQLLPKGGFSEAFSAMVEALTAKETGVLRSLTEVSAVGHRVVHGGSDYSHQAIITDGVIAAIEKACALAPLHNPANLAGIRAAQQRMPNIPHVAVFDTAFHQTMPSYAHIYGLPHEYYEQKDIRRYGFHGISHKYVSLRAAEYLKRPFNELETIVCHLGNGASMCAVDHGRSVDTSMGLTPAEGLIMGSRCGDIDPAVLVHLMRTEKMNANRLDQLINKEGGLKGISGVSNDMREIEAAADGGNTRAMLALRAFCYRVRKYIGAYGAAMGGLDAVVFTGGIGQGSAWVRSLSCQGLAFMGIHIDEEKNKNANGFESVCDISAEGSSVRVLVVPTDEESMIARETLHSVRRSYVNAILQNTTTPIPIEISAHHLHLSQEHVEALFGKGHELTVHQMLSQPGQFACQEKVALVGPRGRIENVRVLGPARSETQVEISMTEQFKLGIQPPIRESGSLEGTPGITLETAATSITIDHGVICALRHIHMTPEDALHFGLKNKDIVRVRVESDRDILFGDVIVRVSPNYKLAMHLDTDEGNAANIPAGTMGYIDGIESRQQ